MGRKYKPNKAYKKMSPEDVQGLMIMRRRAWVQPNGKAYKRKPKHPNKEED